jgi:pimeloyl-ACP methyl ester carboxylesterase
VAAAVVISVVGSAGQVISQTVYTFLYPANQDVAATTSLGSDPKNEPVEVGGGYTGWFVHLVDGKAPLVVFFGGNGDCASRWVSESDTSGSWGAFAGANFMMIDYPGYGSSAGHATTESVFAMSLAAYDYAASRADVDQTRIIVAGYSLGTGPATYVASHRHDAA